MEGSQKELFEIEKDSKETPVSEPLLDKVVLANKIMLEDWKKKVMANLEKSGDLVYLSEVQEVLKKILEVFQELFQNITEVVPYEALGKSINESRELHRYAVEDYKQKAAKIFEKIIEGKEIENA